MRCSEIFEKAFPGCTNSADQVAGRMVVPLADENSFLACLFGWLLLISWSVAGVAMNFRGEFCVTVALSVRL